MENCPFCRIAVQQEPAYLIYEDPNTVAFLDTRPSAPGHTLVVPKKHGQTLVDFSPAELGQVFSTVQRVTKALENTFATTMATIGINHGELSGVPHLHVHCIPRFPHDGGGIIQTIVYNRPEESLQEIAEKIRRHLT